MNKTRFRSHFKFVVSKFWQVHFFVFIWTKKWLIASCAYFTFIFCLIHPNANYGRNDDVSILKKESFIVLQHHKLSDMKVTLTMFRLDEFKFKINLFSVLFQHEDQKWSVFVCYVSNMSLSNSSSKSYWKVTTSRVSQPFLILGNLPSF